MFWTHAWSAYPGDGLLPTDYGWCLKDGILQPKWFNGPAIPASLFSDEFMEPDYESNDTIIINNDSNPEEESPDELSELDDEPWTEDINSDFDDENF